MRHRRRERERKRNDERREEEGQRQRERTKKQSARRDGREGRGEDRYQTDGGDDSHELPHHARRDLVRVRSCVGNFESGSRINVASPEVPDERSRAPTASHENLRHCAPAAEHLGGAATSKGVPRELIDAKSRAEVMKATQSTGGPLFPEQGGARRSSSLDMRVHDRSQRAHSAKAPD